MSTLKAIAGSACLALSLFLGLFVLSLFRVVPLWYLSIPIIFFLGLAASGFFLILKCRSVVSTRAKLIIAVFLGLLVMSTTLLDIHIRHERRLLQTRAKEFLLRPLPSLLIPDSQGEVGGFYVDINNGPQNGVLGYSRNLIARYAITGRIRWSARIQGHFASTSHGINVNYRSDSIDADEAVRLYLAEQNAILGKEWAMGFWQFIEDTIEFRFSPPEIQEEDQDNKFVKLCEGTWTNDVADVLTIEPDLTFSARRGDQSHTNTYGGDWTVGVGRPFLSLFFTRTTGPKPRWSAGETADFRVLQVDDHNLVYKVDNQTNQLRR